MKDIGKYVYRCVVYLHQVNRECVRSAYKFAVVNDGKLYMCLNSYSLILSV